MMQWFILFTTSSGMLELLRGIGRRCNLQEAEELSVLLSRPTCRLHFLACRAVENFAKVRFGGQGEGRSHDLQRLRRLPGLGQGLTVAQFRTSLAGMETCMLGSLSVGAGSDIHVHRPS